MIKFQEFIEKIYAYPLSIQIKVYGKYDKIGEYDRCDLDMLTFDPEFDNKIIDGWEIESNGNLNMYVKENK